jgi:hypothetical protein
MIEPIKLDLKMYEGATFDFSFRIKTDGVTEDLTGWIVKFTASTAPEGEVRFQSQSGDSPIGYVTIDDEDDWLVTVKIPFDETTISDGSLYYEVDTIQPDMTVDRRICGTIYVFRSAE